MSVLRAVELSKTYKQGNDEIFAVKNASFSIEKGEFAAIIGTSGSGKSTLLHMCAAMLMPTSGNVFIDGEDITKMNSDELAAIRRRKIGFVFQRFDLLDIMTARENIMIPKLLEGGELDERYFSDLVDTLGIRDRLNHLPSELSGGQMQRVAIARALINRPSIIFADEPTGNLDKSTANDIFELFKELHKQGNTILMVTHDTSIAERADIVYSISDGSLVKE